MKPLFSVIIATYNREHPLKHALDSLLNQTETNWEAVIINDGSTDATDTMIQDYLQDKRFNYFKQTNSGVPQAKNKGIELANAEYITFLDSDDIYESEHLAIRKQYLNENPEVEFLHGGVKIVGDKYVLDRRNLDQMIHLSKCIIGGTFFIKNQVLRQLGGFKNLPIGTDSELYERAVKAELNILKVSDETYIYNRMDKDSITHNFKREMDELSNL